MGKRPAGLQSLKEFPIGGPPREAEFTMFLVRGKKPYLSNLRHFIRRLLRYCNIYIDISRVGQPGALHPKKLHNLCEVPTAHHETPNDSRMIGFGGANRSLLVWFRAPLRWNLSNQFRI